MSRNKWIAGAAAGLIVAAGGYFAYAHFAAAGNSREALLRALPPNATAVIYVDIEEFRRAAILKAVTAFGASATGNATTDPEYKQFVKESGFDYERDLDRIGIAVTNHGPARNYFALADGKFDRQKIETHLRKNGRSEQADGREIFHIATGDPGRTVSMEFVSNERIALTECGDCFRSKQSGPCGMDGAIYAACGNAGVCVDPPGRRDGRRVELAGTWWFLFSATGWPSESVALDFGGGQAGG